jgi:uncharacterized membrane protein
VDELATWDRWADEAVELEPKEVTAMDQMMGPMMDGWPGWNGTFAVWLIPFLAVLIVALFAVTRAVRRSRGNQTSLRRGTPMETVGERYALGEVTRQQYQEALEEELKDRYVRDEINLEEFEKRIDRLVR